MCLLLLVAGAIVVFYLNRSLIFEQRASANNLRSTTAMEQAEAGLEWATGMLNDPRHIALNCGPSGSPATDVSFRTKYAPDPSALPNPAKVLPGCLFDGATGTMICSCPDVPATGPPAEADLGTTSAPGFTVSFARVALGAGIDSDSVLIKSVGCSGVDGACTEGPVALSSDATATAYAIVKRERLIRMPPAAALTCGGATCSVGTTTIENMDVATNGVTIDAAGPVTAPPTQLVTLAGLPPENSVIAADKSLSDIATGDASCTGGWLFRSYFGSTLQTYINAPNVKTVSCPSGGPCPDLAAAHTAGWRAFYLPAGAQIDGTTALGTAADPVLIVTPGAIVLGGNADVHGIVYGTSVSVTSGAPSVHGAVLACTDFAGAAAGRITYDRGVIEAVAPLTAPMLRVPGSWRDFVNP